MVAVQIDDSQLRQVDAMLREIRNGTNKAISGAINDVLPKMKTRTIKEIRGKVVIKRKDVAPYIFTDKSNVKKLSGQLRVNAASRIPLKFFSPKQVGKRAFGSRKRTKGGNAGVTYRISKDGKRPLLPGGFIGPGGWVGKRKGRERKPVRFPAGVSAYGVFLKGLVRDKELAIAPGDLAKALDRRVNFLLLAAAGKIKQTSKVRAVLK
jgi:hypothetical protein